MNCKLNGWLTGGRLKCANTNLFRTGLNHTINIIVIGITLAYCAVSVITCAFVAFFAGSSADRYNGQHEYYLFHTPNVNQ